MLQCKRVASQKKFFFSPQFHNICSSFWIIHLQFYRLQSCPHVHEKKKFEKNVEKNFNLQKVPIVCYARTFHHKRPLCYALNLYLKRTP